MVDEKDQILMDVLREDASLSTYKLSKKTGIPQTTVLNRIKRLKEERIIKKYTLDLDYAKLGKKIKALIFVKVDNNAEKKIHGKIGDMEARLSKELPVRSVKRLMGRWDFVMDVMVDDVDELNRFLINKVRKLNEVAETETVIVLGEWGR